MATNTLTMSMDTQTLEDHLTTLLDKMEAMRETKDASAVLAKRFRQPLRVEIRTLEFWRSIISECLATFFFVFCVSGAGVVRAADGSLVATDAVATALATGFSMAVLHQCFGKISGGHVNPAVSLAMAVTKKISPLRAALFVLAQCGGGIAGAALLYAVTTPGPYPAPQMLTLGSWERFAVELVLTFLVVFTQCSVPDNRLFSGHSLIVGAAYGACSLVANPVLNPARALGPAFVMNKLWDNHWVFWFGPVLGGILAAVIHEFIFNARRNSKRPKDSIDGDSSSIQSEDEAYDDGKYHPAAYRPVAPGAATSPSAGYCASVASASVYSAPPVKLQRGESLFKHGKPVEDGIYSGTRSLYNAKVTEGIYSGTKSMYSKSPPLTRANLNRSQSVYAKTQNPRDLLPKPGPLVPAQSLYPMKLGGHLNANIRDFAAPNFISGVKASDGNFVKINGPNFNQNTINFLAGRNVGSKSYHDIVTDSAVSDPTQNLHVGNHVQNQNVQNQHLQDIKPDKNLGENIYGVRNPPQGGIYPGNDNPVPVQKRDNYDLVPRGPESPRHQPHQPNYDLVLRGPESPRHQQNFNRTAAYVKSVQNNPNFKPRETNYDIVPSGVREVNNFNQKPHNRSETSDYGSNRSDNSIYGQNRSLELGNRQEKDNNPEKRFKKSEKLETKLERPELPIPEEKNKQQYQHNQLNFVQNGGAPNPQWNQAPVRQPGNKPMVPEPSCNVIIAGNGPLGMTYLNQRPAECRQSPLSSVSSNSFTRSSPNPPY